MWKKEEVDFMSKIEHFSFSQKKKKKKMNTSLIKMKENNLYNNIKKI